MHANAEVLLIQSDGSVILQIRDNKPGITNPGLISSFGGHIEAGEEPLDAAVREINEETNLQLKREQLKFYDTYKKTKAEHGEDWDVYYFGVRGINTTGLEVYEGSGFTVIHNKDELEKANTTKLLKQVLTDYFDGFRAYLFFPSANDEIVEKIYRALLKKCLKGHRPSTLKQPIVLATTGPVASGKSTITQPLADTIDSVRISSDEIRDAFYRSGYSFDRFREVSQRLIDHVLKHCYNVFLDFNASTNIGVLDAFKDAHYRVVVLYAHPPESFIKQKILSGSMKHELAFFTKDEHVYRSYLTWKKDFEAGLPKLKKQYDIWAEIDTSQQNLDEVIDKLVARFKSELDLTA